MARGRERRGSPREMSTARSGTLEFNGEVSPVVVELREGDDSVQDETARTIVCRGRCVASCRREEMRPKVSIPTVMSRAWRRMTHAERSWK
jgi:hypothetical protein